MLCFHRSRPSTASRIRYRGLIVLVFGARITSLSAVSCRILSTTALKTSSQVTAGRPRSPAVTAGDRMTDRRLPATKNRLRVAGHPWSPAITGGHCRLTWPATGDQAKTTWGQQDLRRQLYRVTAGHPRPPQVALELILLITF